MLSGFCVASTFISAPAFYGKALARFQSLLRSFTCPVSPSMLPFLLLQSSSPVGTQVSGVEKLRAKTSYCPCPTHPSSPPASHNHPLPEGSWHTGWDRICCLARDFVSSPGSAVKPELWCLSGGLNSKGFVFWNQALPLREFSPLLNVIEACKCAGVPHFSRRTDLVLLEV